jgi:hypothetical protein
VSPQVRTWPWRFAFVGALASLPLTVLLNRLPNSGGTLGAGVMTAGAFVAGALAASRSDPGGAGLRAGLVGFAVELVAFVGRADTAAWSPSRVAFWVLAAAGVACVSAVFGLCFGRAGGWLASAVSRDGDA